MTKPPDQVWPQLFRNFVVSNLQHWLACARNEPEKLWVEFPQVQQALTYGLPLPEAWSPTRDLAAHLSPLMIRRRQGSEWEQILSKAIARSREEQDPVETEFRLHLGKLYQLQGRLAEADECLQEALRQCDRYQSRAHYGALINLLALVARLSGRLDDAYDYCRQLLARQETSITEQAEALSVMGLIAVDRRQWEDALTYLDQALSLYRSINDHYQMARLLTNQGLALHYSRRWDDAEIKYREAIHHFEQSGNQVELFKPIMNLGIVFFAREDYKAAIAQYEKALPVFKECGYVVDLAYVHNNLGKAHTGLENWATAEAYFLEAAKFWQNLGYDYRLANVLDNLGEMFISAKRFGKAKTVLSQALDALDTNPDNSRHARLRGVIENRLAELADNSLDSSEHS